MDCFYDFPEEKQREHEIINTHAIPLKRRSEFGSNGYDHADLLKALSCYLRGETEHLIGALMKSTAALYPQISLQAYHEIQQLMKLPALDSSGPNGGSIDIKIYGQALRNTLRQLIDALKAQEKARQYDPEVVSDLCDAYLDAFYTLSKRVIFSENNYNLSSRKFRRSKLLKILLTYGARESTALSGEKNEFCFYLYSLFDPFALDTLQRALRCAVLLRNELSDPLTPLRQALFLNSVQSAFRRFVCLDDQLYRVELNRHDSCLLAHPYEKLSSTEETKPVRLFEKTAAYIRSNMVHGAAPYELSVCIIGHTEKSRSSDRKDPFGGDERPLLDLAAALLNWYDRLSPELDGQEKPPLALRLRNFINRYDAPPSNWEQERRPFRCEKNGHFVSCEIVEFDYEEQFEFNTLRLRELIKKNQIVFLLDCPWLSMENFTIREQSSLDVFCRNLRSRSRTEPAPETDFTDDFQAFFKRSAMRELDAQYDRIMSSPTTKAGSVVRIMKDALIRNIQSIIAEYRDKGKKKELYIFSSEQDGINYSYINTYPLTRQERYDGKRFTVVQFMNRHSPTLPCGDSGLVCFRINLWSVLKYICVSYAYDEFTTIMDACLGRPEDPGVYLELYRGILVEFRVRPGAYYLIDIRLRHTDAAESCLAELIPVPEDRRIARDRLLGRVMELIEPLYRYSVFGKNRRYGDDAIKTAFMMNLYSSAEDVNAMLFLHRYQIAVNTENFSGFRLRFSHRFPNTPLAFKDEEFNNKDFFLDKKLYQSLMLTLENTAQFTLGLRAMLYDARELYGSRPDSDLKSLLLWNIRMACEEMGEENSCLYKNTLRALHEDAD